MSGFRLVTTTSAANPTPHDLELDDSGQLVWVGGDITDREDYAEMVAQRLRCRWLMWRAEWYLDQRQGTPWSQTVFRKGITADRLRDVFRKVAAGTPGVRAVVRVDVTITGRRATIDFDLMMENRQPVTSAQLAVPFTVDIPRAA